MIKTLSVEPLFEKFISSSAKGKRRKKNGQKLSAGTIANYSNTLRLLRNFSQSQDRELRLFELKGNNKQEFTRARKYYASFYNLFCNYLAKKKAANNYSGQNIKIIRTFFNWVNNEMGINTGPFHRNFYVLKEDVPIVTLSIEQLNFLIYDRDFEASLPAHLQRVKDCFVIGCSTGLRIVDLRLLKPRDILNRDGKQYININAQKTKTPSLVNLPPYCITIIDKYRSPKSKSLLPVTITCRFNERLKDICERAGWTWQVSKHRNIGDKSVEVRVDGKLSRFCDLVSSHTMRRTCITNMLYAGMPEYIVRKISGHGANSKSFFRYVELAQRLMDDEVNKLYHKLSPDFGSKNCDILAINA